MTLQSWRETAEPARPVPPPERPGWWRRPWIVPLGLVCAGFLAMSLPTYAGLDRARSRVILRDDVPWQYAAVLGHVLFGSVALVTVCLQVWPWLRERHPAVHRRVGRVYVFAGVLPAALLGLALAPYSHGPAGNATSAVLWLSVTAAGVAAARRGRVEDHRRWMIYSFALATQAMWGRVLLITLSLVPAYDGNDPHNVTLSFETATWIGFVINLLLASWWLRRTERRTEHRTEHRTGHRTDRTDRTGHRSEV